MNSNTKELIREGLRQLGRTDNGRPYTVRSHVLHGMSMAAIAIGDGEAFDAVHEMQMAAFRISLEEIREES